jgi:(3S)-malyl-CoA thioesterase
MNHPARPFRSVLYIPASRERALDKARGLPADAIIFDLEDAVAPDEKSAARELLVATLKSADYGPRARIVRINALDTAWGRADAQAIAGLSVDGVLLPKVDSPADVEALAQIVSDVGIWAMMESPAGVLNAAAIAAHPRAVGFVMGTNDLAKDIGAISRADRMPMLASLQLCLLAARAHGLLCIDGVYNAFRDDEGLRFECEQGRDMGFDGKTLIHPSQLPIANAVFAPSEDDIDLARRQIEAFEEALAAGQAVAVVDGRIVENLHVATARRTLEKAAAIAELEQA